ncbi:MAG: hypothetical protein ACI9C4_002621 [Paraglaciecola sp.]|jgi:hypothetical protein
MVRVIVISIAIAIAIARVWLIMCMVPYLLDLAKKTTLNKAEGYGYSQKTCVFNDRSVGA